MRNELAKCYGQRLDFTATISQFSQKPGFGYDPIPTVLLKEIRDPANRLLADHLWIEYNLQLEKLGLTPGDRIRFNARVTGYFKGRNKQGFDYRLSQPKNISKLS
jgi:hypothetical protein